MVVMRRASWLHLSWFPQPVQLTVEDLPFKGSKLFADKTDESVHTLKCSRVTLQSLGIYTPKIKRRQERYQAPQRSRPPPLHNAIDTMAIRSRNRKTQEDDSLLPQILHLSHQLPDNKFESLAKGPRTPSLAVLEPLPLARPLEIVWFHFTQSGRVLQQTDGY